MQKRRLAEGHQYDGSSLTWPNVTASFSRLRQFLQRVPLARIIEGGAIGVALWAILFAFQLLPGFTADTEGVLLFAIVGLAIGLGPLRRALVVVLALAAALVLVVTQTELSNAVASRWIRADPLPDSTADAVVVLSAGLNPNGTINGEGLDHLISGLEIVRSGKARLLVTTTVQQLFPGGVVTSVVDQSRILALFGGDSRWIRTPPGRSTRDEALSSGKLLLPQGIRRIVLVAAPIQTRRACAAFEAVGFEVICVPARARSPGGLNPGPWPSDRLNVFGEWVYEVAGTLKYQMKGWLKR